MTVQQALTRLQELRPGEMSEADALRALRQLDGTAVCEIFCRYEGGTTVLPVYTAQNKTDELLIPAPYEEVYERYLVTRLEAASGDAVRYNNAFSRFRALYDDFADHYNRTHTARCASFRLGG